MKLDIVPTLSIYVADRARKDFDKKAMEELKTSIEEVGVITPLAVCYTEARYKEQGVIEAYRLLAGERRLRICKELGHKEIPVRIFEGDVSRLTAKTIEAAENFYREGLTAEERVMLVKQIHEEQVAKYGEALPGSHTGTGWSQKDTASLLGVDPATVSRELKAAELLEKHPDFADLEGLKKSDLLQVVKQLQREETAKQLNAELEKRAKVVRTKVTETLAEALIVGSLVLDADYDLIIIDARGQDCEPKVIEQAYLHLNPNSYLITIGLPTYPIAPYSPFYIQCRYYAKPPTPSVHDLGVEVFHGYYYRKGNPQLQRPGRSNFFPLNITTVEESKGNLTLYESFYSTFAYTGCKVFIPFVHTGHELIQAARLNLIPVGYTQDMEVKNVYLRKLVEMEVGHETDKIVDNTEEGVPPVA